MNRDSLKMLWVEFVLSSSDVVLFMFSIALTLPPISLELAILIFGILLLVRAYLNNISLSA